MPDYPLLIFPKPSEPPYSSRGSHPHAPIHQLPSHQRQIERLDEKMSTLQDQMKEVVFRTNIDGVLPEQVLVLEVVGAVDDFRKAVERLGMQWAFEWSQEEMEPDEDFSRLDHRLDKPMSGKLFLVITRDRSLKLLLGLWRAYKKDPNNIPRGGAKWRDVFSQLKDIRFWNEKDRTEETGILEDWQERVDSGEEFIRFEVEFWFHQSDSQARLIQQQFEEILNQAQGRILNSLRLPAIRYHAVLAQAPVVEIKRILEGQNVLFLKSDRVMFFRPVGQSITPYGETDILGEVNIPLDPPRIDKPVIALLDGLPLQNHSTLQNRIIVDDPDDWEADYPAISRQHGTAMASLILHGSLDSAQPSLSRPIYVRPIFKPVPIGFDGKYREQIPDDELPVDLLHRAIQDIFRSDAAASSVKILNLSIGDPYQPFYRHMSAWARLLDWLSWEKKILILVSAGNYEDAIEFGVSNDVFSNWSPEERHEFAFKALQEKMHKRRILSPAEAVNVLTVGAIHDDFHIGNLPAIGVDLVERGAISPVSRIGFGFRSSVKPDVLAHGGRQLYKEKLLGSLENVTYQALLSPSYPPGLRVAAPSKQPGNLNAAQYTAGTSNANALTTRTAAQIYECLETLRAQGASESLPNEFDAVWTSPSLMES